MPFLGIYSWDQYTLPSGIPQNDIDFDTQPNDPASPGFSSSAPSWIGEDFTFNGGAPSTIEIDDDDAFFEDGYVETGPLPQTLVTAITIDGVPYPAGSVVENEFSLINSSGQEIYVVRINGTNVGFTYGNGEEPTAGEVFTATSGLDGDPSDNAGGASSSTEPYDDVICFADGSLIETVDGPRPAEMLRIGDMVVTADTGPQPLVWVGQSHVVFTDRLDRRKPIFLPRGCLGQGNPRRNLVVSPQHRMLVHAPTVNGRYDERFAVAKGLQPLQGVRVMYGKKSVTYVHLMLQSHAVLFAEGAATESFYPGEMALRMMGESKRRRLFASNPALREDPLNGYGPLARPSFTVAETKIWAQNQSYRAWSLAA